MVFSSTGRERDTAKLAGEARNPSAEAAPEAGRLYERAGFERWGTEPNALQHDGRSVAEHHMLLRLDDA